LGLGDARIPRQRGSIFKFCTKHFLQTRHLKTFFSSPPLKNVGITLTSKPISRGFPFFLIPVLQGEVQGVFRGSCTSHKGNPRVWPKPTLRTGLGNPHFFLGFVWHHPFFTPKNPHFPVGFCVFPPLQKKCHSVFPTFQPLGPLFSGFSLLFFPGIPSLPKTKGFFYMDWNCSVVRFFFPLLGLGTSCVGVAITHLGLLGSVVPLSPVWACGLSTTSL